MNKMALCLPVAGLYPPGGKGRVQCLVLEPTEQCMLKNRASTQLEFRRIGLATFGDNDRPFLGLGLPLGQGGDTSERNWTRRPVVLEII
ncbi:hypothetical protein RRF57_004743 [Xylaria bambusicola]|uniref:Uncharacterized protein n=1 Tax=Xylaria bambusicola TaxID=326684 RepID=A0AAN7UKG4_9PEZI